jgi:hypothetical protein
VNYPGGNITGEEGKFPSLSEESKSSSEDEDDSEGDEEIPLFLRRDIPPVEEAPEIHNTLTGLWAKRQAASFDLVQALLERGRCINPVREIGGQNETSE